MQSCNLFPVHPEAAELEFHWWALVQMARCLLISKGWRVTLWVQNSLIVCLCEFLLRGEKAAEPWLHLHFFFNPNRALGTTLYSDGGVGNFEDPLWRVRLWVQSPLIVCLCKFLWRGEKAAEPWLCLHFFFLIQIGPLGLHCIQMVVWVILKIHCGGWGCGFKAH